MYKLATRQTAHLRKMRRVPDVESVFTSFDLFFGKVQESSSRVEMGYEVVFSQRLTICRVTSRWPTAHFPVSHQNPAFLQMELWRIS